MHTNHQFGGNWTEEKLRHLEAYLKAYMSIFSSNTRARHLTTHYVDAFAGTGQRVNRQVLEETIVPASGDVDARSFQRGSAQIALEVNPSFDNYWFIEINSTFVDQLTQLRNNYPQHKNKINIIQSDANHVLRDWCSKTDWRTNRAVVFLDPYGMQVEWQTIEIIAHTKAIDLWILFPLGQAVNRLLTRHSPPKGGWAERLTLFFGTEEWKDAFYKPNPQLSLFEEEPRLEKEANFDAISRFFVERLETIFAKVAEPRPLYNSKNVPIYLLCFAAANPKGAPTAVRIAQYLLNK